MDLKGAAPSATLLRRSKRLSSNEIQIRKSRFVGTRACSLPTHQPKNESTTSKHTREYEMNNRTVALLLILVGLAPSLLHAAESQTYAIRAEYKRLEENTRKQTEEITARYPNISTDAVIYFREYMRSHREYPEYTYTPEDPKIHADLALLSCAKRYHASLWILPDSFTPKLYEMVDAVLWEMGMEFSSLRIFIDRRPGCADLFHDTTVGENAFLMIGTGLLEQLSDQELRSLIARSIIDRSYHKRFARFGPRVSKGRPADVEDFLITTGLLTQAIATAVLAVFITSNDVDFAKFFFGSNVVLAIAQFRLIQWLAGSSRDSCYEKDATISKEVGSQTLINSLVKLTPTLANNDVAGIPCTDLSRLEFKRLKKDVTKFCSEFPDAGSKLQIAVDHAQTLLGADDPNFVWRFFKSLYFTPSIGDRILEIKRRSIVTT